MLDQDKNKQELIEELAEMRRRVAASEGFDAERKQIQEALVESEVRLFEIQEVASLGFYVFDIAKGHWTSSRVLDQLFGIPADYEKTVDGWACLLHPDDRHKMLDYLLKEVVEDKKPFDREYRIVRCGDKQVRWVHGLGRLEFNEEGQAISLLGTIQDITERKQAEESLRASEAKYRRLHQSMMDAFVSVDMNGCIREYNEAYRTMLGYEPEELHKLRYQDLTPEKWHSYEAEIVQKQILPRGDSAVYEKEYRRKDGTVFPVELRTSLIKDDHGQPIAMWAIVRDITKRKLAEEGLRQSEQRLSLHFQQTPLGAIEWDLNFKVVKWNPGAMRIFGYSPEDALGSHASFVVPPSAREHVDRIWSDLLDRKGGERSTNENVTKDGHSILCEWYNTPLVDAEGNVIGVASFVDDITERKQAQVALQQAHGELERRVEERTAELREAHDELQTIYDGMTDGLLIADIEAKQFVRANTSICQMLGYSEEELLSKSVMDIHPVKDLPAILDAFQAQAEGSLRVGVDLPVLRKNGSIFFADISTNRILYNGSPCLIGFFRDITERKRIEEALRQSQATLDAFFNASTEILNLLDGDLRYIKTDSLTPSYFGLDSESIVGTSLIEIAPTLIEKHGAMMQRVIATGEAVNNLEIKGSVPSRPGEFVYWRTSWFQVPLPEGKRGLGIVGAEITELKRAEESLRQSEERYRTVVEDQTEIICRFTADGSLTFVNDVYCRLFGKKSQNLVGMKWHPVAYHDDVPMIEEQLRAMSPSNPVVVIENRIFSGQGEVCWMQFVNRGFYDQEGRLIQVQSVGRDITERKRAEEALAKEHRNLRHMLRSSDNERQLIAYEIRLLNRIHG